MTRILAPVVAVPVLYVASYIVLRLIGVYCLYFSQGSWGMDGEANVELIDRLFTPAILTELNWQNRLRWAREPSGG